MFFLLGFFLIPFALEENTKEKPEEGHKSLIRKDLLQIKRENPTASGRNIFIPQRKMSKEGVFPSPEFLREPEGEEISSKNRDSSHPLDLRYIGYIESNQRIVALIIFGGESIAVEKGERISEDYTIGSITTDEIEVIGPSGEKHKFSLEGEDS